MIPKSTRERWRGLSERSSPGAHTVVMCNIDGCVYVKGHGGEHLPPEGNRDMSDEIRLRVLRDRCERLREMPEAMSQLLDEVERLEAERDEWKRRAIAHGCDAEKGDPDCG